MRRRHLVLLLLPGPLILAGILALRRAAVPAARPGATVAAPAPSAVRHVGAGLSEVQLAALAGRLRSVSAREARLDWSVGAIQWLKDAQRTVDVTACDGVLPLLPRGHERAGPTADAEPCSPRCAPVDHRLIQRLPCWSDPPRGWAHLYVGPAVPAPSPPRNLHGPPTAHAARVLERTGENLSAQQVEVDRILGRAIGLERDILACTADAAGLRLLAADVGAPARIPGLEPDVDLRRVPAVVVLRGRRGAMASWLDRLARRPEIWSVAAATVTPLPDEGPDVVELQAELHVFVQR